MSVYLTKRKGWRFDFVRSGQRFSGAGFPTKREARAAEDRKRKEAEEQIRREPGPTVTAFLDLVNLRLDHVRAYNSSKHYSEYCYLAKRWTEQWGALECSAITTAMIERFVLERSRVSPETANKEIRYLRSTFNFGKRRLGLAVNPTKGLEFLPTAKTRRYVPPLADIERVIALADTDTQDYLIAICDTMARVNEVNQLTWADVDLEGRAVTLYTRKKRGGHRTPREVAMTERLFERLSNRFRRRDHDKPWVFWHTYWSSKTGEKREGPYQERKRFMRRLCRLAGVPYFRFHALRHAGASILDNAGVPIGTIQRILGHENRTTTEIYLHSVSESERAAISAMERFRKKSPTSSPTPEALNAKRGI